MGARNTVTGWVTADDALALAGAQLDGVYLGPSSTPETVDSSLTVDLGRPDRQALTVTHPPHYGELTPEARGAFLLWHRVGRRQPDAPVAWPLLHLYGLERRILVDGDDDPRLRQEVTELGRCYGHDPEIARIAAALGDRARTTTPPPPGDGPLPDDVAVEIGRRALRSERITVDWALVWARHHPDIPWPDVATSAPDEFTALWRHRFAERYPDGFLAPTRRRRLTLEYAPSNPSLPSPQEVTVADASDVVLAAEPLRMLREITEMVALELEPYRRWLDSYPDGAGHAPAVTVLPEPLLENSTAADAAHPLVEHARAGLGTLDVAVVSAAPLLRLWREATAWDELGDVGSVAMAQMLGRYGIGIEPDVRFGGPPLDGRPRAVLFRLPATAVTMPSEGYATAVLGVELGVAVAGGGGRIDDETVQLLLAQVDASGDLRDVERVRLAAHLLAVTGGLDADEVVSRAPTLDDDQRRVLDERLRAVGRAGGAVHEQERVCDLLEARGDRAAIPGPRADSDDEVVAERA